MECGFNSCLYVNLIKIECYFRSNDKRDAFIIHVLCNLKPSRMNNFFFLFFSIKSHSIEVNEIGSRSTFFIFCVFFIFGRILHFRLWSFNLTDLLSWMFYFTPPSKMFETRKCEKNFEFSVLKCFSCVCVCTVLYFNVKHNRVGGCVCVCMFKMKSEWFIQTFKALNSFFSISKMKSVCWKHWRLWLQCANFRNESVSLDNYMYRKCCSKYRERTEEATEREKKKRNLYKRVAKHLSMSNFNFTFIRAIP